MGLNDISTLQSSMNHIYDLLIEADTDTNLLEYNLENARLLLEDILDEMGTEWSAKDRKIHIIHDCIIGALENYKAADTKLDDMRDTVKAATASTEIEITRL